MKPVDAFMPYYYACGSDLPPPVVGTTNELKIKLRTDGSVSHRGFKATWTTEGTPGEKTNDSPY